MKEQQEGHPGIVQGKKVFFETLNRYFDRIYVLTIAPAEKRRESFSKDMEGLDFHFFYGVDRQELDIDKLISSGVYDEEKARTTQRYKKSLTPSEIACAWGHRNIYEDMVKNRIERAMIFEDDAFPVTDNMRFLPGMLASLPADWDLFYLDYNKNEKRIPFKRSLYHLQRFLGLFRMDHTLISHLFPKKINPYWQAAGFHDYTDAYAVTRKGAEQLIQLQTPFSMTADNLLANASARSHIKAYIATPKLFSQKSVGDFSSIESLIDRGFEK
jgi:glycosyl transferase family 25